ncbi:hypothetical protein BJ875DRAFT_19688 [Amylocarpus encephaloides]|uniref:TM7S3/TM198-like domain-containing protein n=1 Tax=Amylocarpus encephaloides TaxID=45428 RepID=A0A9P7YJR5_9HELO|nr:hypothetical protein BJ875DRAFT_19688 [Amylocarpus encephaloides]
MVLMMKSKVLALLLLCFCINIVVADRWGARFHRRDGPTSPSITTTPTSVLDTLLPSSSATNRPSQTNSQTASGDNDKASSTSVSKSKSSSSPTPSSTISTEATSSDATSTPTALPNDAHFNSTLTPNELPITPRITPGFGVAGVILMLTGATYTVVGIKNKFLHIFLSAAYLSALSIVVLILYVMNLPVSNSVQGAYVVAATMTGLIIGGGAIVFTEMTEGLGSLLGGFCLSMWLLVLKPGGLLTSTTSKSIFIASFTVVGFVTSFSHYTRPYGLIGGISFGGATVLILGIDCFSRAGLKEFWTYLWNLNDNLFPLGATTYPLTRGIKVEIAAIVVLTLAGIVSQMKLWKVIEERREKRNNERLEDERTMRQEEDNVGRRVEDLNAQERTQWETVYGDKDQVAKSSAASQRDSGVGDMESQKKGPTSVATSIRRSGEEGIEMTDIPSPAPPKPAGLVMERSGQAGGQVMIRVARDLRPEPGSDGNRTPVDSSSSQRQSHASIVDEETIWPMGADGEVQVERRPSRRQSKRSSNPPVSVRVSRAPDVVPLPFKVPEGDVEDDGSSVATFADEEANEHNIKTRYLKHISAKSALIRRLSDRSLMSPSPRSSKRFSMNDSPSTEDLVIPHEIEDGRASSVAATMDGLSDDDEMRSIQSSIDRAPDTDEAVVIEKLDATTKLLTTDENVKAESSEDPATQTDRVMKTEGLNLAESVKKSLASSTDPKAEPAAPAGSQKGDVESDEIKRPRTARSGASASGSRRSRPSSFTAAQLPAQLSKVVMSYRTNEWAKHLSNADAPEVEALKIEEHPVEIDTTKVEVPAPVNVQELQQTADNTAIPLMPGSRIPHTKANASPYTTLSDASPGLPSQDNLSRSLSQQSLMSQPNNSRRHLSGGPIIPQPIVESPIEDNFASPGNAAMMQQASQNIPFGSANTLMERRESMVRNKSFYTSQVSLPAPQEAPRNFPAQAHGNYRSMTGSRISSDAGSIYNNRNGSSAVVNDDDDNMSLSQRRTLIHQSSLQNASSVGLIQQSSVPFDSHQPQRQSSVPTMAAREQQLASWRASVQQELQSTHIPKQSIERQRSALWQERQADEQRRVLDARKKGERDSAFDERMRRGDMLDAHRDALRKMQARASKNA